MSVYAKVWAYDQHPLQVDSEGKVKPGTRNPAAKAVLVALAEFPGVGQRECWPSQATLAGMTDFEERTVRKHLDVLERQGLISRTERRKKGQRLTDMVTLLGPIEAFGPAQKPPERHAGSNAEPPERHAANHRNVMPGNRHKEPSVRDTNVSPRGDDASASPPTGSEEKKKANQQKQEQARQEYESIVSSNGKLGKKLSLFVESAAQERNKGGTLRSTTKLREYGEPFLKALNDLPRQALEFGLDAAVRNKAKTFPYVTAAAEGYDPAVHERFKRGRKPSESIAITNATQADYDETAY